MIQYIEADERLKAVIAAQWSEQAARHMRLTDGFSLLAVEQETPVGLISVQWRNLPIPLAETCEAFIDIIEVHKDFRRQGIATRLLELATERAKARGAFQLRAWSSEDKTEAIPMWKALGFGLCPATIVPRGQEVNGFFVALVL